MEIIILINYIVISINSIKNYSFKAMVFIKA